MSRCKQPRSLRLTAAIDQARPGGTSWEGVVLTQTAAAVSLKHRNARKQFDCRLPCRYVNHKGATTKVQIARHPTSCTHTHYPQWWCMYLSCVLDASTAAGTPHKLHTPHPTQQWHLKGSPPPVNDPPVTAAHIPTCCTHKQPFQDTHTRAPCRCSTLDK